MSELKLRPPKEGRMLKPHKIDGSEQPTPDIRLQTPDYGLPTTDCRLRSDRLPN
jgi:hypothetical protein